MDSSPPRNNRPYTNEGLAPMPPDESRKSSRSYRTVSPRQITLYERPTAPSTAPSGPAPSSARRKLRSKQQHSRTPVADFADSVEDDPARLFEYTGNDFLKPTSHTHVFVDRPTTASIRSTQFPTLSDRLKAQITVSPQVTQDVRKTFQQPASGPTQPQMQQSAHGFQRKQTMLRNNSGDTNASAASADFQSMNVRDLLRYMLQADDQNVDDSTFVHVASRYNIEYVPKPNFYDLVVLEKPGQPKSGYVWTRDNPKYTPDYHVLPPVCIMQLSLKGLLVTNEENGHMRSEMIPLAAFFHEKANFDKLRQLRFFGFFRELRVFKAWHTYTQHTYINRMKDILMKDSYFSDSELMKMQVQIAKITYEMEIDLEFFVFHGRGAVCVTDYFKMQLLHIEVIKAQLTERIDLLAQAVEAQHGIFMHSKKLEDLIQEVKDHHPLRSEMRRQDQEVPVESTEQKVDWIRLRSIQRLRDNFVAKVRRLLRMAQYRVEFKVALLLERFWLRFKQFVVGVPDLRKANLRKKEDLTYWEIDHGLFGQSGSLQPTAFDFNISLHDEQNPKKDHDQNHENVEGMLLFEEPDQAPQFKFETYEGTPCYARINKDWETAGSHLCVRVELFYRNRPAELNDFVGLHNVDTLSVCITPTKSVLLNQIHGVCGSLGRLIQNLPDLNKHAIIYMPDYKPVYKEPEVDLGLGELNNSNSGVYFTTLIMKPIFNSRSAYQLAIDSIRQVNQAYNEATSIDSFTFKLYEVVRKLWSLSPSSVVKQIERSVAVPKIRTFIELPDSVEDLKRSQGRDKSRLIAFKTASTYLEKLPHDLEKYCNLKHRLGFITSFAPLLEQISNYRAIQSYYLMQKLPTSYATRCTIFYDLLRRLEGMFDAQNKNTMELIEVMRKLKHFDAVREHFDCEVEFCNTIYNTILQAENKRNQSDVPISLQELKISQLLASKSRSHAPTVSPEKLQRVFQETLERMAITLARLRSFLLTQLVDVKEVILSGRQKIHSSIRAVQESIEEFEFMMHDEEAGTNIAKQYDVSSFGDDIVKLRKQVDESVSAQLLLLEAHDIVGAANMILLPNQVDQFSALEELEKVYATKCQVGDILRNIHTLNETIWTSRMSLVNPFDVNRSFTSIITTFTHLQVNLPDAELLELIENKIKKLSPRVELVVYLPSKTIKPRHWQLLAAHVLKHCGLEIKLSGRQSEFVALVDVTGREPVNMGNVNRLGVKDFLTRDVHKYLNKTKFIVSEAVIESFLESTLDTVDNALRVACTQSSTGWVKDSRLREKISLELSEILNIVPLKVVSKFCSKAIMIVEATSQDMGLTTFDHRTFKMKEISNRIDKFLDHYQEIQYWWMYVLHFVKFTPRGEMDRDSIRAFNNVTEDMKKIEGVLQQKGGNIYSAFTSASESDMSTENLRSNLSSILDDVHSSVQSLMDSCPRLTLLSYNRLIELYRVWLLGPQTCLDFVSLCMREMFEGVGKLHITLLHSQKIFVCNGFTSHNFLDKVSFSEPISLTLSLDDFVNQFAMRLKQVIEKSCDVLMVHRINCMKALLVNAPIDVVIKNMHALLQLRVEHLEAVLANESLLTSTFLLVNHVSFAEDIWTCLGHPSGSFVMARSDLLIENAAFTKVWKDLLGHFIACSEANIVKLQHQLLVVKTSSRISIRKIKSILSGWILQEFSFISIAKHLLECDRVESAIEAWMGHYQLRFQYAKNLRYSSCPLDIVMGNIMLSYGMEYQECGMASLPNKELGFALGRILSSAFCLHATTIVHSSENISNPLVNTRELTVSGKDIAMALGRISITLTQASQLSVVKSFFSKVILLDAVGCVDFSTITQSGLQNVIQTAQQCWSALDSKNDQIIQDSLKFPLKARFSRNELHSERRRNALKSFHNDIYVRQKLHTYVSFILVGFASESEFTSCAVADQYCRSIFDVVTIPFSMPYANLGALLSSAGFLYGFDLQDSFLTALGVIHKKAETDGEVHVDTLHEMCRIDELVRLVEECRVSLALMSRIDSTDLPKIMVGKSTKLVERYKEEVVCFCGNLWDRFVTLSYTKKVNYNKVRTELFGPFLSKLEPLSLPDTTKLLISSVDSSILQMRDQVVYGIIKSANSLGFICKDLFVQYCASLMERLLTADVPVTLLSGEASVGKSVVLSSVMKTINSIKTKIRLDSQSLPVVYRLSAKKIFLFFKAWKEHRQRQKVLESKLESPGPERPISSASPGRNSPGNSKSASRKQTRVRVALQAREEDKRLVTMLYHGSLSASNLIGSFDSQGRWSDGLLVRKIRLIEAQVLQRTAQNDEVDNPIDTNTNNEGLHFIVLNGPISSSIQELFHCMIYQSPRSVYPVFAKSYQLSKTQIVLPTNECIELSERIKIIVESSDLSSISPSLLPMLPNVHIAFTAQESIARILTVWMRSVYHWLGDFSPWLDFLDELNNLLISSKFIEDLLYDVLNMERVPIALVNSCLGSFLRVLEELLLQVNEVALEQSHFVVLNEKDVATDSSSDEEPASKSNLPSRPGSAPARRRGESFDVAGMSEASQFTYVGSMSLHPKGREQLLKRARLSIIYAAIWGFGGAYNSSDKRKFFDGVLRDAVQQHMDTDLNVPSDVLVYELLIDIRKACLVPAYSAEKEDIEILAKAGLSQKYLDQYLYCKLVHGEDTIDRLIFHNTSSRALSAASRLLTASGSNLLVFGSKGCGKTRLLQDMLSDLQQSTPNPALLRQQIVHNLLDIASGAKTPKGIFKALEIIRTVLLQSASEQAGNINIDPATLKSQTFNRLWRDLTKDLESYLSGSSRINCRNKAVSSSSTSLIGHSNARSMRGWFEREFATEVPNVLETGRFTYGVAFIDDLHYLANDGKKFQHALSDQIDDVFKGILHEFPLFGIERNSSVRSVMTLGNHVGSNDGAFKINTGQPPILHKESYSDARLQVDTSDDYMLQRMGLFGAATGHLSDHMHSSWFKRLVSNYAVVSMPSMSVAELHTAFITGAIVSMSSARADFNLLEVLQTELVDLSRITLNTGLRMVSAVDTMLTTPLERVLRTMTMLDIGFISRFNLSLRYGCMHVKNPGGLLQLYAHEWKRCILDPLPDGAQRDRITTLFIEYLDNIDEKTWGITRSWLIEIKEELKSNVDRVWTNATVLSSRLQMDFDKYKINTASAENESQSSDSLSMYLPISMDVESYQEESKKGVWNVVTKQFNSLSRKASSIRSLNRDLDMSQLLTDYEVREVMYPAALSLLLRLVRVLSVAGKHVILAGYPGSSKRTAILLAAKICQFSPLLFVAKESQSAIEGGSNKSEAVFDFRLFLKTAVLKSAGFTDPITLDDLENNPIHQSNPNVMLNNVGLLHPGQVYYEISTAQRVLAIVGGVEQLNSEDRRKLIHVIDYDDPTVLFSDAELIGMVDALRKECRRKREQAISIPQEKPLHTLASDMPSIVTAATTLSTPATGGMATDAKTSHAKFFDSLMSPIEEVSRSLDALDEEQKDPGIEVTNTPKATTTSSFKSKLALTGYLFQWIKSHLKASVQTYLHIAYLVEFPRTIEVNPNLYYSNEDCLSLLRKLSGHNAKKKVGGDKKLPISTRGDVGSKSNSASRRFSMQTNHKMEDDSEKDNATLYNPSLGHTAAKTDGAGEEGAAAGESVNTTGVSNSNLSTLVPHGIFTCPILGPVLARRFHLLWYDVDYNDGIRGICESALRNVATDTSGIESTKASSVLPLQSSTVGMYNPPADVPAPTPAASTGGSRRMSVVEKQAIDKEEKRKQKFMYSSSALSKYALNLQTDYNCLEYEGSIYSMIKRFGVLDSFELHVNRANLNDQVERMMPQFIEEAKALLPHLLQFPLPSDAVFLREPVFSLGPESIASKVCHSVRDLIHQSVSVLLKTKLVYEEVLSSIAASLAILHNDDDMDQKLIDNNDELSGIMRSLSKEVDKVKRSLDSVHITFQKSREYEQEQMLTEHIAGQYYHIYSFENVLSDRFGMMKKTIRSFVSQDWHTFSAFYGLKPVSKTMIEVMRAVMVVISYNPPKILKGEKGGGNSSKMDDEVVAKCAISLLLKPNDFANQLCNVDPLNLSATQINALRIMNSLLNPQFVTYMNTEFYSPARRWERQQRYAGNDEGANIVFDCLRQYLLLIDLLVATIGYNKERLPAIEAMEQEVEAQRAINLSHITDTANMHKQELDRLVSQMGLIDGSIMSNRKKLDIIDRNRLRKGVLTEGLSACRLFLQSDHRNIHQMLETVVADVCVAAVILHRCGWLPESKRQDCLDILRRNLRFNKVLVNDTPFTLGCLVDRLHIRSICGYAENSLNCDVPTINAVALLFLCPKHAMLIDADGLAMQTVLDCIPKIYEHYSIPGHKFSLSVFSTWVEAAVEKKQAESAICLVLYDIQAGVSDDLICLLTSRLDYTRRGDQPRLIINSAHQYIETSNKENYIVIPNQFKIVLLSTKPPTFDSFGNSSLLPLACMDDITVIHWTSSICAYTVENKLFEETCEKRHLTSNALSMKLVHKLIPMLTSSSGANNISAKLQEYDASILEQSHELLTLEHNVIRAMYECIENDKESYSDKFSIDGMVEQSNVSLNILSYEHTVEAIISPVARRRNHISQLINLRSLSREYVSYLDSFQEVFSMIGDYTRICGYMLPTQDFFSPHSLTTTAIVSNVVPSILIGLQAKKIFSSRFPVSLYSAYRTYKGVVMCQRIFRGRRVTRSSSVHKLSTASSSFKTPSATQLKKRESTMKFDATANKRMVDEGSRTVGLIPLLRQKALSVLQFLLVPLRARLTTEVLRYIETQIQPGYEYLIKYMLLLVTSLQTNQVMDISNEEVRTVFHMLFQHHGINDTRFIHLLPVPRQSNDRVVVLSRKGLSTMPSTFNADSSVIFSAEYLLERGSGMMDGLYVNTRSAIWSIENANKQSATALDIAEDDIGDRQDDVKRPTYQHFYDRATYNQGVVVAHGKLFAVDHCVDIVLHTKLMYNPVTYGDTYEVEYIKCLGLKAFHTNNSLALLALGAGLKSIEEINQARRYTVQHKPGIKSLQVKKKMSVMQSRKNSVLPPGSRKRSMLMSSGSPQQQHNGSVVNANYMRRKNSMLADNSMATSTFNAGNNSRNNSIIYTPKSSLIQHIMHSSISARRQSELQAGLNALVGAPLSSRRVMNRRASRLSSTPAVPAVDSTSPGRRESKSAAFSPLPTGKSAQIAHTAQTVNIDELAEVVQDASAYQSLFLLESHPAMSPIFKGICAYISRNVADFLDWKDSINRLHSTSYHAFDKDKLVELFASIQPPACMELDEFMHNANTDDKGLFMQGFELSVLQAVILAEALWPGSAVVMMELYYRVVAEYLSLGGYIILHNDEALPDPETDVDESAEDDEEGDKKSDGDGEPRTAANSDDEEERDSDENEEHDTFDTQQSGKASSRLNSVALRKSSTSSFFRSLREYEDDFEDQILLQDDIHNINCWFKLIHVFHPHFTRRYLILPEILDYHGKVAYTVRDYYNWESICYTVFSVDYYDIEISKFVHIKEMRRSVLSNAHPVHFLASQHVPVTVSAQLSLLSQRTRQYALVVNRTVPIVHCDLQQFKVLDQLPDSASSADGSSVVNVYNTPQSHAATSAWMRGVYMEMLKGIRTAATSSVDKSIGAAKKVVLERVDIASAEGIALLGAFTTTATTTTSAASSASSSTGTSSSYIVSSPWGTRQATKHSAALQGSSAYISYSSNHALVHSSLHPPLQFADNKYLWLPRFLAADLVHTQQSTSSASLGKVGSMGVSIPESYGLFYEELESSLLSILTAHKYIKRLHITPEVSRQLVVMNKVTLRMLASILVLTQAHQYLICQELEAYEPTVLSGNWSNALCSLTLWQLSRLLLKLQEIFQVTWLLPAKPGSAYTAADFQAHAPFNKAIGVLVESLTSNMMDYYHVPPEEVGAAVVVGNAKGGAASQLANRMRASRMAQKGVPRPTAKPSPAAAVSSPSAPSTTVAPRDSLPISMGAGSIARTVRLQKQYKKALRKMEENRLQYLHHLGNAQAVRQLYGTSQTLASSHRLDAQTWHTIKKTQARHQNLLRRDVASYVAEILCRKNSHRICADTMADSEVEEVKARQKKERRASAGLEQIASHLVNARRHSTKMNIHSVIGDIAGAKGVAGSGNGAAGSGAESVDHEGFWFGALSPMEAMQCVVQWTLDSSEGKGKGARAGAEGGVDFRQVLRSIKRLSISIQQGQTK